jgi:hypothetical protein
MPTMYENVEQHVQSTTATATATSTTSSSRNSIRQEHRRMMGQSSSSSSSYYNLGGYTSTTPRTFHSRREPKSMLVLPVEDNNNNNNNRIDVDTTMKPSNEDYYENDDDDDDANEEKLEQLLEEELRMYHTEKNKTRTIETQIQENIVSTPTNSHRIWTFLSKRSSVPFLQAIRVMKQTRSSDQDGSSSSPSDGIYFTTEADHFYNVSRTVTITTKTTTDDHDTETTSSSYSSSNTSSTATTAATTITQRQQRLAELTVYCPEIFTNLRSKVFGISEEGYISSLLASGPFVSFQSNSKGAARVGGMFFFTRDGAYMIKSIKADEAQTLIKILPKYYTHMKRYGRSSLLTRFCGMYGVTIEEEDEMDVVMGGTGNDVDDDVTTTTTNKKRRSVISEEVPPLAPTGKLQTFVVMNAVFPAEASKFISERFDLKGSTVGREVSDEELEKQGTNAVFKDLDLMKEVELVRSMGMREFGLTIGATAKAALLAQLREDVKFLVDVQVMDYSLLVGVVHMDIHKKQESLRQAITSINQQHRIMQRLEHKPASRMKLDTKAIYVLTTPVRLVLSPPLYMARKAWNLMRLTLDSIITKPMPYYGSGTCGIDGGKLSIFHGKRRGDRAVYYMGLIDFLQPWTVRKVLERRIKTLLGYDSKAISSVSPEEYASRFLDYLDANIT